MLKRIAQISEKKKIVPRTAILFLCYKDLREIEWIIPSISKNYDAYDIYVPCIERSLRTSIIAEFLTSSNGSLHTYTELLFKSKLGLKVSKILPSRVHTKIFNLLEKPQLNLFYNLLQKFLTKKAAYVLNLRPKTAVYFSLVFCKISSPFKSLVFNDFEKEKIPFSAFAINFWGKKPNKFTINNVDYTCTAPLEHLGRMRPVLIKPFMDFYLSSDHWTQIKQNAKQRKIAVFFTKNFSALNYLYNIDCRKKYRQEILKKLQAQGFYIVIKPHPGESIKNNSQNDSSTISELPSPFLCKMADATIFELPTNSIFEAMINNRNVYLPLDLLSDVLEKSIQKIIDEFPPLFQRVIKEDCFIHVPGTSLRNYPNNRIKKYISNEMEEV